MNPATDNDEPSEPTLLECLRSLRDNILEQREMTLEIAEQLREVKLTDFSQKRLAKAQEQLQEILDANVMWSSQLGIWLDRYSDHVEEEEQGEQWKQGPQ